MTNPILSAYIPWRVAEHTDWTAPASGSTDTGKVWVWNNGTSKYEATTTLTNYTLVTPTISSTGWANANHAHTGGTSGGQLDHGAALTGLGDNDHPQYFLASGVSGFGGSLIDDADAATARGTLGLGTMATATESAYPLLTGTRAFTGAQTFNSGIVAKGATSDAGSFALIATDVNDNPLLTIRSDSFVVYGYAATGGRFDFVGKTNTSFSYIFQNNLGDYLWIVSNRSGATGIALDSEGRVGIGGATTMTSLLDIGASNSTRAAARFRPGVAPTSAYDGDVWYPTSGRLTFYRGGTAEIVATGVTGTGAAATAGASYTSTEQAMLQAVYNAARNFGLIA